MPRISSGGAASSHLARVGSSIAPPGTRFGGRADLRSRLFGAGVLGPDDLAEAELVLEELAYKWVLECFREPLRLVGVRDLDPFMKVVSGGEVALGQFVHPRVLEVPDRTRLANELAVETDDLVGLAHDLGVLPDLPLRSGSLFVGYVTGQGALGDFAPRLSRCYLY